MGLRPKAFAPDDRQRCPLSFVWPPWNRLWAEPAATGQPDDNTLLISMTCSGIRPGVGFHGLTQ